MPQNTLYSSRAQKACSMATILLPSGQKASPAEVDLFKKHAGTLLPPNAASRIDQAEQMGGILVRIPAGTILGKPIQLTLKEPESTHVVVIIGAGAKTTIVHESVAASAIEVFLEPESQVEFVSLSLVDARGPRFDIHGPRAESALLYYYDCLALGSSITWHLAMFGGSDVHCDLRSEAIGEHASSTVNWMVHVKGTERIDLSARNVFSARDGGGEITIKGIAEDRGVIRAHGMIDIGLGGGGTNTYLTQEVLMLDASAKVDAVPALEIKTNDVKASHSASIACVTEEDLFYFASRGIDQEEARGMFIRGFLGDVAERISNEEVRERVVKMIEERCGTRK